MNFSALQARVSDEVGLPTSDSAMATRIKAWINQAYQHISGALNWPWLIKNYTLQTVADITTGTVSINAASTSLTFSSAPSVSVANDYMILFTTTNDWYTISSHTAASTSATLSVPYVGTSNLTAGTYTLRKVYYSLGSDVDRILDIRQTIQSAKLESVDVRYFDRSLPDPQATGSPLYYAVLGYDTTDTYLRVTLYPTPDAVMNLQVRYYVKITELSASTDTPLIPAKWHNAIVMAALAIYGHSYIDDARIQEAKTRYDSIMKDMMANYGFSPDKITVIRPWDQRPGNLIGSVNVPLTIPQP